MPKAKAKQPRPNPEQLTTPIMFGTLTKGRVDAIKRVIGPAASMVVHLYDVDVARGEASLGPNAKCIWLKNGRRVTFAMSAGALVASVSNERDPFDPKWKDDER